MTRSDLSISQRLACGFGLLFLLLAGLVGFVFILQDRSIAAERHFEEAIAPRAVAARELERSVMTVGLAVRGFLLANTPESFDQYQESVRSVRERLQRMSSIPLDADDRAELAAMTPGIDAYLEVVRRVVEAARGGQAAGESEHAMSAARQTAVAAVRRFTDLQVQKGWQSINTMGLARNDVRRALILMSVLTLIGFVGIASATARSIRRPTGELLRIAGALQAGDWQPALAWAPSGDQAGAAREPRSEMTRLARAFGAAAAALEHREGRLRADAAIAAATGLSLHRDEVASATLRAIADHVRAEVALVYWHDEAAGVLEPVSSHAPGATPEPIRVGEGIPGRAAETRHTVLVRDIPRDTPFTVRLGYDATPPRVVAAVPILFRGDLLGVMVLASLRELDAEAVAFLEAAAVQFGIGLQNVRAHEQIERLVAALREQNGTIQAQNEEIQAQNEEIQAQAEELQAQNEELQAQNEEIQAQNDQIRERAEEVERQRRLLADADARKNEFLATLGHELRNPMAALTVSLKVFNGSDPASERGARARAVIERQVQHLIRLIDDLLDVTRISRGKISIERTRLELGEVVRACVDDQHVEIDAKGLALDVDVPAEPIWIDGDRTRLCQMINNLLHNACKFTDGGGRLSLRLSTSADRREAVLRVTDSGVGIDPRLLPQLFEPFRQGATTLARTNTGLGLGLALVKTFAELHGGTVEARSEGAGRGSEFVVRLPLPRVDAGAGAPRGTADASPGSTRSWRMLVVEDNPDAAWSLSELLAIEGHRVEVAYSGGEALDKARAFAPELVLCDIGLPGMDGYELARRLRADERWKGVPLVALTGYAAPADQAEAMAAGFDYHVAKPLDVGVLRQMLAALDSAAGISRA